MPKYLIDIPKVAIILGATSESDRGIIHGILSYAKLHGPWRARVFPTDCHSLKTIRQWGATGIIAQVLTEQVESILLQQDNPIITIDLWDQFLETSHPLSQCSEIRGNSEKVGIMAADFYLKRQFHHFAYISDQDNTNWSKRREVAYVAKLKESGFSCEVYRFSHPRKLRTEYDLRKTDNNNKKLIKWLVSLPKPIAIFVANDFTACQVIEACQIGGLSVPTEISVLGVDNDVIHCESTEPSLSSIARNHYRGGYAAAEHLDHLMRGQSLDRKIFSIEPTEIIIRHSTKSMNIDDALVLEAIQFIQINSGLGMNVNTVVRHLNVARRLVEQRFRSALGITIHDEIERVRMEKVKSLLLETDLTIREIANLCSFNSEMYLSKVFKKRFHVTMSQFRQKSKKTVF